MPPSPTSCWILPDTSKKLVGAPFNSWREEDDGEDEEKEDDEGENKDENNDDQLTAIDIARCNQRGGILMLLSTIDA